MATEKMPHPGHENHLCHLVEKNSLKTGLADYKKLVQEAQYICKGCGRTAAKAESLCAPEKL
jgi:hypothetical protein